jgi:Regulator of G protein signaling domain
LERVRAYQVLVAGLFQPTLLDGALQGNAHSDHASPVTYGPPAKPSSMKDKDYAKLVEKATTEGKRIYTTFVEDNSPQEINIESKVKKAINNELLKDNMHPDIYYHAFQHIMNMLQTNHYRKFILHCKKASEKAEKKA